MSLLTSKPRGKINWWAILTLAASIAVAYIFFENRQKRFIRRKKITWAIVYDYSSGKSGYWIDYTFCVNDNEIKASDQKSLSLEQISRLIDQRIALPVAYDSVDPKVSEILLRKEDFTELGLPFPDTMQNIYNRINR